MLIYIPGVFLVFIIFLHFADLKTFRDLDKSGISGENHNNQKSDEKLKPVENNQASTTATGNKNEKEEDKNIDQSTEKSKVDSDPNKETNREPDKLTMPKDTDDANVIIGGKLRKFYYTLSFLVDQSFCLVTSQETFFIETNIYLRQRNFLSVTYA